MFKKIFRGCLVFIGLIILAVGGLVGVAFAGSTGDWDWSWEDPLADVSWDGSYAGSYSLQVEPFSALVTEPVDISASGFTPNQLVGVRAKTVDKDGNSWESAALFEADGSGNIDLARQAPVSGSYEGVAPMGLFWSMRPTEVQSNNHFQSDDSRYTVALSLEANGQILQEAVVERLKVSPEVVRQDVSENGVRGVLYYPENGETLPSVFVIGGSEGGIPAERAALWASQGYAAFAIGYFGYEGGPKILSEIPLETFDAGLSWLKEQPMVDADRIALASYSRGTEAGLLTAASHPEIAAVIAEVPSFVVWSGLDFSSQSENRGEVASAWTRNGEQLPANSNSFSMEILRAMLGRPAVMHDTFQAGLNAPKEGSIIPVEEIQAPILLISSSDDMLWPSTEFADKIVARLESNRFEYDIQQVQLEGAGHFVKPEFEPPVYIIGDPPTVSVIGGTREANGKASAVLWRAETEFLAQHLGR